MKSYLALGDSYTIGELQPLHASFPYQLVQLFRNSGIGIHAPEIVAKTGWTTDELTSHINSIKLNNSYDLVTLLIGVNNQYRGRTVDNFIPEIESLIQFALSKSSNVVMLSIPDWGVTPFAEGKDKEKISNEIDMYNAACEKCAANAGIKFIDITASQRLDGSKTEFLAEDKLHPSFKEYKKWAKEIFNISTFFA